MQNVMKNMMDEAMKNMGSLQAFDYSKTTDLWNGINNQKIGQQLLDFHKNTFENGYNAIETIQVQSEKIADTLIKENAALSTDNKKLINEWRGVIKKGQVEFKKSVEDTFKKAETYLGDVQKESKTS